MQLRLRIRRPRQDEKGATAALVVVIMVTLLGMAAVSIDYATGVQARQRAQDAADAAALAVGNACATGNAGQCTTSYAQSYVTKNAPGATATVNLQTPSSGAQSVTVKVTAQTKSNFAKAAFGKDKLTAAADAKAVWNGTVKEYLPAYPIAMEYCNWKLNANGGGVADYKFGNIPNEITWSPSSSCLDPEDGKKLLVGPKPGRAVVMTGNAWWPTWDSSKCKVPSKISVWQNLGANMIDAAFSTNAACRTLFQTLKPGQTILVPLYAHRLRCVSFLCFTHVTDYIKIVGFVPFRIATGKPFYYANTLTGGYPSDKCDLEVVSSIFGWLEFGCNRITGSFVKTTQIFPDATYGTVTGYDPIKAAISLKLTDEHQNHLLPTIFKESADRMNGRVIAAVAAALLAILGLGAAAVYVSGADARAFDGATLVKVFVVEKDIPADADAAAVAESVSAVELPQKSVAVDAVEDLGAIKSLRTTVPLVKGEQLIRSRFDEAGSAGASGGAGVPKGMQEVSLKLETANAGGPSVKAGSKVGIIVTTAPDGDGKKSLSKMFLQNILVTGVTDGGDGSGAIVTLAVNGEGATKIAAAAQSGVIRLTAQNVDTDKNAGGSVSASDLVK